MSEPEAERLYRYFTAHTDGYHEGRRAGLLRGFVWGLAAGAAISAAIVWLVPAALGGTCQ